MNIPVKNVLIYSAVVLYSLYMTAFSQNAINSIVSPELIFETLALNKDISTPEKPKYLSPTDIAASPDKSKLYVAEQTAKQIAVIAIPDNIVIQTIKLPNEVTGIAVSKDGSKLYATITSEIWPEGYVCVIKAVSGKVDKRIKVGHSPRSPVISPDGNTLYVCNQFNNDISVVDLTSGKESNRIEVIREPYCARITQDGSMLVVANALPLMSAIDTDSETVRCSISLIDLNNQLITVNIKLPTGSSAASGVAITPDGKYALVTHVIAMYNLLSTQITGGWVHRNNLAIIDLEKRIQLNDISLDYSKDTGCASPWGIECTADGKFVVVAHAGSNEISIIDLPQMINTANTKDWLSYKIDLLNPETLRKRVTVEGKHPRALTTINNKAYVAGYFGSNVEVFDIGLSTTGSSEKINLGDEEQMIVERKGEYHFYSGDKSHCQGAWQSCHSCHPFTRADGFDWFAAGVTMMKNTKSLLFGPYTMPPNWASKHGSYNEAIAYGIIQELGVEAEDSIVTPVEEFFKRLKALPSPCLVKGRLSKSAARGREIYHSDKTDCKVCHPAPLFTNQSMGPWIVPDQWDASPNFDTPSIIEAWRTAPWDHIGTTTDFEALLKNPRHSNCASKLTDDEFRDLMEYVLSL